MNSAPSLRRALPARRLSIFIPLAILAAGLSVAGFWPRYFGPLLAGTSEREWFFGVHAAMFMGWIFLVISQAWCAATGRLALHVRIGRAGFGYGVLLVLTGLAFTFFLFARAVSTDGYGAVRIPVLAPLTDLIAFSIFLAGAWFTRRRPGLHRRFILLTVLAIIIPGATRLLGGMQSTAPGDVVFFLAVWLSPLWLAMAWDAWRERRIHPVYIFGALLLTAVRYRHLVRRTDTWNDFMRWLVERFL
jgi:hypothetical protein